MPRYAYKCADCGAEFMTMHSADTVLEECNACNSIGNLEKLLTRPSYSAKPRPHKEDKPHVGEVTENFIKEAREDLKTQHKELYQKR
mgnify:CR=1 FL=1